MACNICPTADVCVCVYANVRVLALFSDSLTSTHTLPTNNL